VPLDFQQNMKFMHLTPVALQAPVCSLSRTTLPCAAPTRRLEPVQEGKVGGLHSRGSTHSHTAQAFNFLL